MFALVSMLSMGRVPTATQNGRPRPRFGRYSLPMSDLCRSIWCVLIGLPVAGCVGSRDPYPATPTHVLRRKSHKRLTFCNVDHLGDPARGPVGSGLRHRPRDGSVVSSLHGMNDPRRVTWQSKSDGGNSSRSAARESLCRSRRGRSTPAGSILSVCWRRVSQRQARTIDPVSPAADQNGPSAIGDTLTTVRSRRCAATQAAHPTKGMRT
jgi:hypothetical protein